MSNTIVTPIFKNGLSNKIYEDLETVPHYVFFSKITQYVPNDITIAPAVFDQGNTITSIYDDLIFGKKILPTDLSYVIRKVTWESGQVYDQYSYSDPNLLSKDFYVAADQGALTSVYKCLNNGGGVPSTIKPTGLDTSVFQTSDGYVWKYLYSFDEDQASKFGTADYMPIVIDQNVLDAIQPGTIDSIHISNRGSPYANYLRSSFTTGSIRFNGDPEKYLIDTSASFFNDFYNGCIILITSGPATGDYKKITNFEVSGPNKIIELESSFVITPQPGDTYEIMPSVTIIGDGNETEVAVARAVINEATGVIDNIDILNPGANYRKAQVSVYTDNTAIPAASALLEASISPQGGHGSDLQRELGGSRVMLSVEVDGSENGRLPVDNDFRIVGILKDPLFNNLRIYMDNTQQIGAFRRNEKVIQYMSYPLSDTVSITASSNIVATTETALDKFVIGDSVLITNGTKNHYGTVSAVGANSINLSGKLPTWTDTEASIKLVKPIAYGTIEDLEINSMLLRECSATWVFDVTNLLGADSFATVVLDKDHENHLSIHTSPVDEFKFFNQLYKIDGAYSSDDTFVEDEVVNQGNGTTAVVHSTTNIIGTDTLNLVNLSGPISTDFLIGSSTSLATFTINNQYPGDLDYNSGEILYIEHLLPITRSANTAETVKILLSQ